MIQTLLNLITLVSYLVVMGVCVKVMIDLDGLEEK